MKTDFNSQGIQSSHYNTLIQNIDNTHIWI